MKIIHTVRLAAALSLVIAYSAAASADPAANDDAPAKPPQVERLANNPILRPEMMPKDDGPWSENLNFPSVIRVPKWIEKPLGKYYLYFSAHHGSYIRLAYTDQIEGPWTIYKPGTLRLKQVEQVNGNEPKAAGTTEAGERHVASPDVLVDDERHELRMYFHAWLPKLGHSASVAISQNGREFEPRPGVIAGPYLRVVRRDSDYLAIDDQGQIVRSPDGLEPFKPISQAVKRIATDSGRRVSFRHGCLSLHGDALSVFFTRIGDAPERILWTRLAIAGEPSTWSATPPVTVLEPERDYEGSKAKLAPSSFKGETNVRQLRDPCVFEDGGQSYLLYAVAGESGIAVARINGQ